MMVELAISKVSSVSMITLLVLKVALRLSIHDLVTYLKRDLCLSGVWLRVNLIINT